MKSAYLGLGSNIEPRYQYLIQAISLLNTNPNIQIIQKSSIYETAPWGLIEQGDFLNMVLKITTPLDPLALLDACQNIEQQLQRHRTIHWGPRTMDIDILLYNELNLQSETLTLPHPEMLNRAFVLVPLSEIEPQLIINGQSIAFLKNEIIDQPIKIYRG